MEESIYNIIPKEQTTNERRPLYRSKYPPNLPPTSSTFGIHTTSKPISNLSGQFTLGLQAHPSKGAGQTFGHLRGDRKTSPENYQKKRTGTMGNSLLPPVRNFSYDCSHKKQAVPKAHQRPVHGIKLNRNFIVTNAVENILSSAKKLPKQVEWTKKKDYGQNPQYLQRIKKTLHDQYQMIQTLHSQKQQNKKIMAQEQKDQLREGLKARWNQLNREYQRIAHIRVVDTVGLKRKKQKFEEDMAQIQRDIKILNKQYILVED